jgi:hypothetical protein
MIFVMDPAYTCILLLYKDCATDEPKELGNKEENQLILTRLFGNTFGKLADITSQE